MVKKKQNKTKKQKQKRKDYKPRTALTSLILSFCSVLTFPGLRLVRGYTILDKRPWDPYCNNHIFLSFLGSPLKHRILFEIFLQFSLPPPYIKLKFGKHSEYMRPTLFVGWGEGFGPVCIGKCPRNAKVSQDFCL